MNWKFDFSPVTSDMIAVVSRTDALVRELTVQALQI